MFDLPEEILATIQLQASHLEVSIGTDNEETQSRGHAAERAPSEDAPTTTSATSCALCGLTFADLQEQRNHVRSDLHGYNLKQKARGLKPVSEADFEKLIGGKEIHG